LHAAHGAPAPGVVVPDADTGERAELLLVLDGDAISGGLPSCYLQKLKRGVGLSVFFPEKQIAHMHLLLLVLGLGFSRLRIVLVRQEKEKIRVLELKEF